MADLPMRPPLHLVEDGQAILAEGLQLAGVLNRLMYRIVTDTRSPPAGDPQHDRLTGSEPGLDEEFLQVLSSFVSQCIIGGEHILDTAAERGDDGESCQPGTGHGPRSEDQALSADQVSPFFAEEREMQNGDNPTQSDSDDDCGSTFELPQSYLSASRVMLQRAGINPLPGVDETEPMDGASISSDEGASVASIVAQSGSDRLSAFCGSDPATAGDSIRTVSPLPVSFPAAPCSPACSVSSVASPSSVASGKSQATAPDFASSPGPHIAPPPSVASQESNHTTKPFRTAARPVMAMDIQLLVRRVTNYQRFVENVPKPQAQPVEPPEKLAAEIAEPAIQTVECVPDRAGLTHNADEYSGDTTEQIDSDIAEPSGSPAVEGIFRIDEPDDITPAFHDSVDYGSEYGGSCAHSDSSGEGEAAAATPSAPDLTTPEDDFADEDFMSSCSSSITISTSRFPSPAPPTVQPLEDASDAGEMPEPETNPEPPAILYSNPRPSACTGNGNDPGPSTFFYPTLGTSSKWINGRYCGSEVVPQAEEEVASTSAESPVQSYCPSEGSICSGTQRSWSERGSLIKGSSHGSEVAEPQESAPSSRLNDLTATGHRKYATRRHNATRNGYHQRAQSGSRMGDQSRAHGSILYLSGIPTEIDLPVILSYIRGGKLERIEFVNHQSRYRTRSAKVAFVNPEAAARFLDLTGGYICLMTYNATLEVAWSRSQSQVDPEAIEHANNPKVNASRVLFIQNISRDISEQELRADIEAAFHDFGVYYAGMEAFSVNYDVPGKGRRKPVWEVLVHLYSLPGALATRRYLKSLQKYRDISWSYGDDECAESIVRSRIIKDIAERATTREEFRGKLKASQLYLYEEAALVYYGPEPDYQQSYSNFEIKFMEPGFYTESVPGDYDDDSYDEDD